MWRFGSDAKVYSGSAAGSAYLQWFQQGLLGDGLKQVGMMDSPVLCVLCLNLFIAHI